MTNNEVRQNIAISIEAHKACALLHQTRMIRALHLEDLKAADRYLKTMEMHTYKISECVDEYKRVPANDAQSEAKCVPANDQEWNGKCGI